MSKSEKYLLLGAIGFIIVSMFISSGSSIKLGALQTTGENSFSNVTTQSSSTAGIYAEAAILAAKTSRQYVRISNITGGGVYLGFGNTAHVYEGVYIAPGESYEINPLNSYKGAITAIASSSTSTLSVIEK